ncbi:inorganic diphosphatase [Candidatus Marsarchaeota archaeon]|jgi:inorganic pyrophosphatase|nr:inorganic diphosphatase [Candidatus Marsarchaeota archaeon]MCL5089552.1 inorganic diphosphatase [Candidatus Marsarchaeota archaeon]
MKLDAGKEAPKVVNAVIEIPMFSNIKYEFDEEHEALKVDRVLYTSMVYPFNYGFIPGTWGEDNDPLDILVISNQPFVSGSYIKVKPIGIAHMEDEEGKDSKIMAVPVEKVDPNFSGINDIMDLNEEIKKKIIHFFGHYKELEPGKWVKITDFGNSEEAQSVINAAVKRAKSNK